MWYLGVLTSKYAWENKHVQHFIHNDKTKFDLIINEQFFQESWLSFAHKYKTPIVSLSTFGYSSETDNYMGLQTPLSYVPHAFLHYSDQMSFIERCLNVLLTLIDAAGRSLYYIPAQQRQALKYMKHLNTHTDPMPTIYQLENKISLVLSNTHNAFDNPRPRMRGHIDIAGINLNKFSTNLPPDIQKFMDEAEDGIIYFNWGPIIQSSKAPKETILHMITAFKGLKQRIIMKWENENQKLPSNIMAKKWLPQKEILEHPKMLLFLTHGGMFSVTEALFNGVPMLFTPFFGDQHSNAERAVKAGYGKILPLSKITLNYFMENVNEMLNNKSYSKIAKTKSIMFRDNLNDPLEEAIYWIEYVIRHNGADHLKPYGINLNYFQYNNLDIVMLFGIILIIAGIIVNYVMVKIIRKINQKSVKAKLS